MNVLWVFLGGGLGSVLRFGMSFWLRNWAISFPWPTFAVNLTSCLLLGVLAGIAAKSEMPVTWRLLLLTGFCGGFSTFSTFSFEAFELLQLGRTSSAVMYLTGSVLTGLAGILAGWYLSRFY